MTDTNVAFEIGLKNVMVDGSVVNVTASSHPDRFCDPTILTEDQYEILMWSCDAFQRFYARADCQIGSDFDVKSALDRVCGSANRLVFGNRTHDRLSAVRRLMYLQEVVAQYRTISRVLYESSADVSLFGFVGAACSSDVFSACAGHSHCPNLVTTSEALDIIDVHPVGKVLACSYHEGRPGDSHYITMITDHGDYIVKFTDEVHEYGMPGDVGLEIIQKSSIV